MLGARMQWTSDSSAIPPPVDLAAIFPDHIDVAPPADVMAVTR
jgi:hypothetical protein